MKNITYIVEIRKNARFFLDIDDLYIIVKLVLCVLICKKTILTLTFVPSCVGQMSCMGYFSCF